MATTISTTLKKDPLVGAPRSVPSPFSLTGRKKPYNALDLGTYKSTNTVSTAPKNTAPTPVQSTPIQSYSQTPQAQSNAPINGLLKPDYSSLSASLKSIQGGLVDLQNQQEQKNFPNIVGGLVNASNPNTTQTGLVQNISDVAGGNRGIADEAKRISEEYARRIAEVGGLGAGAVAGALSTGTDVVGSGNAAIASQSASQRMQALAQAQEAALRGTGQQLTAQEQTANALTSALGGANTQQQQQLSGLANAGSLAAPQFAQPGQAGYDPLNPGGSTGSLSPEIIEQYAQLMASNQGSAIPASITGNSVLNAQVLARAKQINPSFNPTIAGAQMSAIGGLVDQAAQLQAQAQGADANFQLLLNIAQQGGVNQSNVPILNTLQQNVNRGLTSQEAVANFQSILQTVRSQYASIIGGGTVTVESLNEAKSIIPDDVSLAALISLSKNLEADAANRITGINNQVNQLSTGGAQGGFSNQGTSSGTISWDQL